MILRPSIRAAPIRQLLQTSRPNARRTLIAAPKPNSGPLMERRSDRALPSVASSNVWLRTLPLFAAICIGSTLAIFNYQKSNSSVVSSTMYSLRTNEEARNVLGDEIYFAQSIPWIWGSIDQVHGRIDIQFAVKGTRGRGMMRFRSERARRMGYFETVEWSLQPDGGERISLLQPQAEDPSQAASMS